MAISFDRTNLPGSGSAKITFDSVTLWTRSDIVVSFIQNLVEQVSSMYGRVARTRGGRKIEFELPVYGFWNNLSVLFPSYLLNFQHGARIFGTSDKAFVLLARNGDRLTIHNVRLTGMSNLKLAANQQVFSGTARFTGLIANNTAPTSAAAFYTIDTGQTYTEGDFPQSNFKSLAWTGAWGVRTGFTSIKTQEGWDINWEIAMQDDLVDGIGAIDMFVENVWLAASCIPVGPTLAQIESNQDFQGTNADVGATADSNDDDLVLTDGTSTFTMYNAAVQQHEEVFAPMRKRQGTMIWTPSLREFSSNAVTAIAALA
jgi:hypothetical protein